ncbi:MAG: phage major capsid protein [Micrococcaceae bacterium]|nr:phage major capsid protein [Micrococcaceae bacterium]
MPTLSTVKSARAWSPDLNMFAPEDTLQNALILDHSTVSANIDGDQPSLRVGYVADDEAQFTAEGNEIPESEPALNEVLVYTGKITQLVRLTNEQYRQAGTADQLAASTARAITKKADQAFLTQSAPAAGKNAPPAGLVNIDGITVNDEAITANLDPLVDLVAQLEANGSAPTGVILDPLAWAALRKLKTSDGSQTTLIGAGTNDAERLLLSLPVTVTPAMQPNSGLVVDHNAVISAAGPVRVDTDESVYFTSDGVAVRATWRIGWNVVRPERLGKFTVTANSTE